MKLPVMFLFLQKASAIVMMAALLLLVSGNYWAYGFKKDKSLPAANASGPEEDEPGHVPAPPNPTEEKASGGFLNASEYLHDHFYTMHHPVAILCPGHEHGMEPLPVYHPELLTPPPKRNSREL